MVARDRIEKFAGNDLSFASEASPKGCESWTMRTTVDTGIFRLQRQESLFLFSGIYDRSFSRFTISELECIFRNCWRNDVILYLSCTNTTILNIKKFGDVCDQASSL